MNKLFINLLLISLLHICLSANDENPVHLSIEQAIQMSLEASEDFEIKKQQIKMLDQQYLEVKSQIYPQINAESSWSHNPSYDGNEMRDYENNNTISGSQLLWSFGKVESAIRGAKKAFLISQLNKNSSKQDVIFNTKNSYYAALFAEDTFKIIEASYKNSLENKKILEERSSKGRVSKRDNIKISADVAARMPDVNNSRSQLKTALNTLKIIIGKPFESKLVLADSFSNNYNQLNYLELESNLLTYEPTLQALKEQTYLQSELITQRKAAYLPELSLFGNYSYRGSGDDAILEDEDIGSYSTIGIKVTVPIFNGGAIKSKLNQAKIDQKISVLNHQKTTETFTLELKNAVSNYHSFLKTLKANNEAVNLSEQSFDLSQELFKTGQLSVTDLNDAELQLTNQKLAREQTIYNINTTLAKIEKLTKMELLT